MAKSKPIGVRFDLDQFEFILKNNPNLKTTCINIKIRYPRGKKSSLFFWGFVSLALGTLVFWFPLHPFECIDIYGFGRAYGLVCWSCNFFSLRSVGGGLLLCFIVCYGGGIVATFGLINLFFVATFDFFP